MILKMNHRSKKAGSFLFKSQCSIIYYVGTVSFKWNDMTSTPGVLLNSTNKLEIVSNQYL